MSLNKDSMKRLKVKQHLENDVAEIFGVPQNLDCSFSGHFLILIYNHDINTCLMVKNEYKNDKRSS